MAPRKEERAAGATYATQSRGLGSAHPLLGDMVKGGALGLTVHCQTYLSSWCRMGTADQVMNKTGPVFPKGWKLGSGAPHGALSFRKCPLAKCNEDPEAMVKGCRWSLAR